MDNTDIDDLLRRVRPAGPPAELRARLLRAAPAPRAWPWVGAAAASLVAAAGLQLASSTAIDRADMPSLSDPDASIVQATTDTLGGDVTARRLAEFMLIEQELRGEPTSTDPGEMP
jgi:hypothetical protein